MIFLLRFCIYGLLVSALIIGCASKPVYRVQVKEVLIPIKCNLELPQKPIENGSFESHKALAIYFQKVEQVARDCTGAENGSK